MIWKKETSFKLPGTKTVGKSRRKCCKVVFEVASFVGKNLRRHLSRFMSFEVKYRKKNIK